MNVDQVSAREIVTVGLDEGVGTITLGAPALTRAAKEQLLTALRRLSAQSSVRAIVLTGTGKVFDRLGSLEHVGFQVGQFRHSLDDEHRSRLDLGDVGDHLDPMADRARRLRER